MSNWIRNFQKRKHKRPRRGVGTRGQRKGPAKMGQAMPRPKRIPIKMPGVRTEEAAAAMHEACKVGGVDAE